MVNRENFGFSVKNLRLVQVNALSSRGIFPSFVFGLVVSGLDKEEETAEAGKSTEKGSECSNWGLPSSFSRAGVQAGRYALELGCCR